MQTLLSQPAPLPFAPSPSLNLEHLEEVQAQHALRIPLVSGAGAHLADLSLSLRFFHSRSPGSSFSKAFGSMLDSRPVRWVSNAVIAGIHELEPRAVRASGRL